ncbi:MAG: aromatic ring-hydroxylating dioxygenase subunit alpha [Myxococcales bacterium]|nr:aromatic ring-hydroxylating dioxygenase subunit alpha [Myxococcales bacterium]
MDDPLAPGNVARAGAFPAVFAEEIEKLFCRNWLCVGRETKLAKISDYFVVDVGEASVIVLRDRDGAVRAFHNLCRHRGTRLCEAREGRFAEAIRCPYHSWTYGLDGRLQGAPSTNDLAGFDRSEWPLLAVATGIWHGFVFVNLAADPAPVSKMLARLEDRVTTYDLGPLVSLRGQVYDVAANWKLIVENYSECYHCAPVHPALAKLSPPTSGENDFFEGPLLGGYMELSEGNESLTMTGRACGVPLGRVPKEEERRVYYYSLLPNLLLSLHPDYAMFHTLWPQSPGRTRITCDWLFHPDTLGRPDLNPGDGIDFWDLTNRQDWHICEQSQAGIASPFYRPGPYSHREALSMQFDREVLRQLGHPRHY